MYAFIDMIVLSCVIFSLITFQVRRGLNYIEQINQSFLIPFMYFSMFAGSASGKILPPYVVYKAQNLY